MGTDMLKRQHSEVVALAKYILEQIGSNSVEKNLDEVVRAINTISGKLKLHLMNEDKFLYPKLNSSSDPQLRKFGKQFGDEMEVVTKEFEAYKMSYNTAAKIKQNLAGFENATKKVFFALSKRIEKEERELYPLLD